LRGARSALELRVLQKQVVEGLVAASMERTAATGRGFQDTGSTAKAFEGEEVDWYACNVAIYHMKQSMDPSLPLVENEDLKRWLLVDDEMLVRVAAMAVGNAELELLLEQYKTAEDWIGAAKVARAIGMVSATTSDRLKHGTAALALLEQAGSDTTMVQQLELDIRSSINFLVRSGPEKTQMTTRIKALMAQNQLLRVDPLGLVSRLQVQ
jgi:hypothetical protein